LNSVEAPPPDPGAAAWQAANTGDDVFRGRRGFAWFKTELGLPAANGTASTAGRRIVIHFESVDDNVAVFLNGKRLMVHEGWNEPFDVDAGLAWKTNGKNTLDLLIQNTYGGGGVTGPVTVAYAQEKAAEAIPPESTPGFDDNSWRQVHLPHDYV